MNDTTDTNPTEPVLDAPAAVGGIRFAAGVKWSTVIEAAQRHYRYVTQPERERERIRFARRNLQRLQAACDGPPYTSDLTKGESS